ncbi:MAG: hypothetical protein LQ342_005221 [Letrouitia transgressa]|nr:MAG: hypothetical protein LQ342_005221 [Letrouitia transgressa]
MASQQSAITGQVASQLVTTKSLNPTEEWLSTFMATQKSTTPVSALVQTALFRLLASDIQTSLTVDVYTCFPVDLHDPNIKERRLQGPIVVQLLGFEDMSKSRWEQIEAIEALERGEGTKGREIIRVTATEEDNESGSATSKGAGPHKLLLQDAQGTRAYAIELQAVQGVGVAINIGCKFVLKNITIARGVFLLTPASTTMLGGKIEALHETWKTNRKAELKVAIEAAKQTQETEI